MKSKLKDLHHTLNYIKTDQGPHDATLEILYRLVSLDKDLVPVVRDLYDNEGNSNQKEILAMIMLSAGESEPYRSYLKQHHAWEDQDF